MSSVQLSQQLTAFSSECYNKKSNLQEARLSQSTCTARVPGCRFCVEDVNQLDFANGFYSSKLNHFKRTQMSSCLLDVPNTNCLLQHENLFLYLSATQTEALSQKSAIQWNTVLRETHRGLIKNKKYSQSRKPQSVTGVACCEDAWRAHNVWKRATVL